MLTKVRDELIEKVAKGEGAIPNEKYRLIYGNIAMWHDYNFYYRFEDEGALFVDEDYLFGHIWGRRVPANEDPLEGLTLRGIYCHLNRPLPDKVRWMIKEIREFKADGVVYHSNRSCKLYTAEQYETGLYLRKAGIPVVHIDGDHGDSRVYSRDQSETRVRALLETIAEKKKAELLRVKRTLVIV